MVREGMPYQAVSAELGDRIIVNSIAVRSQEIIVATVDHGEGGLNAG
jgi:hypothetical protein